MLAVIGVISSIAMTYYGDQHQAVVVARDRRNAQELVSVCTTAAAAGISFVSGNDPVQTARNIVRGQTVAGGAFNGKIFRLGGMSEADIESAAYYLDVRDGNLIYVTDRLPPG